MSRLVREQKRLEVVSHYLQIQEAVGEIGTFADERANCRHSRHATVHFSTEFVSRGRLFECGGIYRVWLAEDDTNPHAPDSGTIPVDETYTVLKSTAAPRVVAEVLIHVLPEDGSSAQPSAAERLSLLGD